MPCRIEVIFTPSEQRALRGRDLSSSMCIVFDVLRATSSFVTALTNGAEAIIPVEEMEEALELRRQRPDVLLAGEREGLRIGSALTGGVEFDLGNSPREYTRAKVAGKTIVSTTTNGTRALRACSGADCVAAGSFLNLKATGDFILKRKPGRLLLVCAGTGENEALEDTLAAGALCEELSAELAGFEMLESAATAKRIYNRDKEEMSTAVGASENGSRLLAIPELRDDVGACLRRDSFPIVAILGSDGAIRKYQ